MLKALIVDISKFNKGDSLNKFKKTSSFDVMTDFESGLCPSELFLITDNRDSADIAKRSNIGFAAYTTNESDSHLFSDSLYIITSLSEMTDENIIRMHQRANNLPWTIFETERTVVREITLDDIDDLYSVYSDPETVEYIENLYPDKADERDFTSNYIKNQYRFFEYGLWAVTLKPDNRFIGRAGIFNRDGYDTVELGFVFDKSVWGLGVAYEVCSAILEYASDKFGFTEFIAFTKPENARGKRLLERLGFIFMCERDVNDELFYMYALRLR